MPAKIELGTLIHGTLRNEDLAHAFMSELDRLDDHDDTIANLVAEVDSVNDWESELGSELVNEMIDALSEYAPDGYYFGAIEGDGSDFGFWAIEDED